MSLVKSVSFSNDHKNEDNILNNPNQNLEFVFSPETSTETMKKKDHEAFDDQFVEEDQNILYANHHRNVDL